MMNRSDRKSQSGNMFIYIIGAIFLIGLLVVIMRGGFQPGTGIDAEKAILEASKVRKYTSELEAGVTRILTSGVSETDLRFAHANAAAAYGTPGDTPARQVFEPEGGGVEWQAPPAGIQVTPTPWLFNARNGVDGVGSDCTADSCMDLIAFLVDVTKEFCIAINNSVGVTNPSGVPPKETSNINVETPFAGVYQYHTNIDVTDGHLFGQKEGCFEGGNSSNALRGLVGKYYYYKVLYVR